MRIRLLNLALVLAVLTACGGHAAAPQVPSLTGGPTPSGAAPSGSGRPGDDKGEPAATGAAGDNSEGRRQKLHAAAECIRQHGIPTYHDPVLTSDGHVYTDARSYQDASGSTLTAVERACHTAIAAAQFQPNEQAPAPPNMVQAGVKVAQCLRANGMPNVKDPTSSTYFTPGHGFGLTADQVPAGGKENPVVRHALETCRPLIDTETRLSTLESLDHA